MAKGYNYGWKHAKRDILLFAHDDTRCWFGTFAWDMFVAELAGSGFGGVVGYTRINDSGQFPPSGCGSGGCIQSKGQSKWLNSWGVYGRTLLLDGMFMACRRSVLERLHGFDEDYPGWHFYDIDICLRAHLDGLLNFTYPLLVEHVVSGAGFDNSDQFEWQKHWEIFRHKHSGQLPHAVTMRTRHADG